MKRVRALLRGPRTIHTGDLFQGMSLPFIDVANGNGSATAFGSTLDEAVNSIREVDTIISGHHTAPLTWNDFVNFNGFYNDIVTRTQDGQAAEQTVDQIVESYSVPADYSDFQADEGSLRSTVQYVYDGTVSSSVASRRRRRGRTHTSLIFREACLARIIRKGSDFGSQDGVIVSRTKDRTLPLSSAGHVGRKIGRMARCERPAGQLRRGRSREAR